MKDQVNPFKAIVYFFTLIIGIVASHPQGIFICSVVYHNRTRKSQQVIVRYRNLCIPIVSLQISIELLVDRKRWFFPRHEFLFHVLFFSKVANLLSQIVTILYASRPTINRFTLETILQLKGLTKKFGSLTAVNNLSFDIQKGNVYGILGPNGSGKSTTLGMVLNVVNPTSGSFNWFDGTLNTHEALKKVGAIIESPNFYPSMSAEDNLKLVCKIKGVHSSRIDEVLEIVNLLDRKKDHFKNYSLGMKQRLAIASALLNDPEILILDEPTNGLDPQGIHQIREIMKKIASEGMTILLASHLLDEVEKVCTHVVVIRKGVKLYSGHVDEMNATHGFFELKSESNSELKEFLEAHPAIGSYEEDDAKVIKAILSKPYSAQLLNQESFDKNIILTHLVQRKETLEEQFLKLTKEQ
jgi:ABC-2 type transport system ATP-binding protein